MGVFLFTICVSIGCIRYYLEKAKQQLSEELVCIFESAVKSNVDKQTVDVPYFSRHSLEPNNYKIGDYETRTAWYADTTFTYQVKITDPETSQLNFFQTYLLDTKQLRAIDVKLSFDSLLAQKDIHHIQSVVGINSSFYTKLNDWSSDTTEINATHRVEVLGQGNYEDINYYGHVHRPLRTLWGLMPTQTIFLLFVCTVLTGLLLLCWNYKLEKDKRYKIKRLSRGNYRINEVLFEPKKKKFTKDGVETKLADQPHDLFMLFLKAESHRVSKEYIKMVFWPANMNPNTNMTSAINRLNKELKDVGCFHTIVTDLKDEDFYVLTSADYSNEELPISQNRQLADHD